jgi:hypothetical protein
MYENWSNEKLLARLALNSGLGREDTMTRVTVLVLMLALLTIATGCGSMVFNVSEPQASQLAFKNNWILWESWDKDTTPLPATVVLNTHRCYIFRLANIPLHEGAVVYGKVKTFGNTPFSKAGKVPLVIDAQVIDDVQHGNVVRIVVVDPKKEHQTKRFVQLTLSPTEDAMKSAKQIGKPLALVVLGNRAPKYIDLFSSRKATSY